MCSSRLFAFTMLAEIALVFGADVRADSNETKETAAGLYRKNCQRCHGMDGTGLSEKTSLANVPDFTSARWQQRRSDAQLRVSLREGKGERMPPFGDVLQDAECIALVAYVRSLGPRQQPMATQTAEDFQKRWDELRAEWEDLQKQMRDLEASRAASTNRHQRVSSDRQADDRRSTTAPPKRDADRRTEKILDSKPPEPVDREPKKADDPAHVKRP